MNKYDFISTILEKERFDVVQKEKVLRLVVSELKIDGYLQEEIENRLKIIEKKINENIATEVSDEVINTPEDLPKYIDPIHLSSFLIAYNQNNLLKYTCHEIDASALLTINEMCETDFFDLKIYHLKINIIFDQLTKEYIIPRSVYALINNYINGDRKWSSDSITASWNSKELIAWSEKNIGIVPNPDKALVAQYDNFGYELKEQSFSSSLFGKKVTNFSQLVIHFKNLFHIRSDNSLIRIIEHVNKVEKYSEVSDIDMKAVKFNIEFFTDVDKLIQSYKKIISIILKVADLCDQAKPQIKLILVEEDNEVKFTIWHLNSTYMKTISNTVKRIGDQQTDLIKKQINGLCNLYIKADFGDNQFAKINLWDGKKRVAETIEPLQGVQYILCFK